MLPFNPLPLVFLAKAMLSYSSFFSGQVLQLGSSAKKTIFLTSIFSVSNKDVIRFGKI